MSPMPRLVVVLSLLCAPAVAGPRTWVEVRSAHFTVLSDAGEPAAREAAWQFEQARSAYAHLWQGATAGGGRPYVVFAARDETTLRSLAPGYFEGPGEHNIVSGHVTGADRQYVTMRVDADTSSDVRVSPYFTPYRAYVGTLLGSVFTRRLPPWLYRGLVEAYGNTRVRKQDVLVARMVPWHLRTIREERLLPLSKLFSAAEEPPGRPRDPFDATSWALVHYLIHGERGALALRLNRFMSLWQQGLDHEAAVREAFGEVRALEKGLDSYVSRGTLPYRTVAVDAAVKPERFTVRPLGPGETAAAQAALHVAMGREVEARGRLAEARAADVSLAAIEDAEGLLADLGGDDEKARSAYQKAVEKGSTSFYSHYRLAQLTADVARERADKEGWRRAAAHLERAIGLHPEYASAHSFLAELKSYLGERQGALAIARTATVLEPRAAYHHLALARVLTDLDQPAEALASARRGLALATNDHDRRQAEELIGRIGAPSNAASTAGSPPDRASETAAPASGTADRERTRQFWCTATDSADCEKVAMILGVSCEAGKGADCAGLAQLYTAGLGVAKDPERARRLNERARKLLEPACRGGDAEACRVVQSLPR